MPSAQLVSLPVSLGSSGWVAITQGFGGSTSHSNTLYHSLDIKVGRGTPVYAESGGIVVSLRENVSEGSDASSSLSDPSNGPSNIGNYVTILYNSGLYVTYAHLKTNGVVPDINQVVSAGDVLGYVGNTGYRTGTHLHVQYGFDDILWTAGIVANGSQTLGTPVVFDTAAGALGVGIVSEISFDLSSVSQNDLYLLGANSLRGWGDADANVLSGNRGDNILDGRGGNDTLLGGAGNDRLIGGLGTDILDGGTGTDTADYSGSSSSVSVNLGLSSSQYTGSSTGYDTLRSVENAIGGTQADTLRGNSSSNRLEGGAGNDTLFGNSGRDVLIGGSGIDILVGGSGQDELYGGADYDYFVFNSVSESGTTSSSRDIIRDFQRGDKIDLRGIDANSALSGDQSFKFIGSQSFHKIAGELRYASGIVSGDVNGDGVSDFQIQVFGESSILATDFLI